VSPLVIPAFHTVGARLSHSRRPDRMEPGLCGRGRLPCHPRGCRSCCAVSMSRSGISIRVMSSQRKSLGATPLARPAHGDASTAAARPGERLGCSPPSSHSTSFTASLFVTPRQRTQTLPVAMYNYVREFRRPVDGGVVRDVYRGDGRLDCLCQTASSASARSSISNKATDGDAWISRARWKGATKTPRCIFDAVTKRFGDVVALNGVSLAIGSRRIHDLARARPAAAKTHAAQAGRGFPRTGWRIDCDPRKMRQ